MEVFESKIGGLKGMSILDVGGYPRFWSELEPVWKKIVVTNLDNQSGGNHDLERLKMEFSVIDGCDLPYLENEFDIVFSNSVIEHVGDFEAQKKFASEMLRVGKKVWVQTPAKEFFIEPHYITPFIHWIPCKQRKKLIRNFTLWGWVKRPSPEEVEVMFGSIRLIKKSEMTQMFPTHEIYNEKFLGIFTKSYTALGEGKAK